MLCTPWQLAQFATSVLPELVASPWKLDENVLNRSPASPYFSVKVTELWNGAANRADTLRARNRRSDLMRKKLCSPWQSVHTGASLLPLLMRFMNTLAILVCYRSMTCTACLRNALHDYAATWLFSLFDFMAAMTVDAVGNGGVSFNSARAMDTLFVGCNKTCRRWNCARTLDHPDGMRDKAFLRKFHFCRIGTAF